MTQPTTSQASPLRVVVFLGTRPEAIKLLPVLRELQSRSEFDPVLVTTGQHGDLVPQILEPFGIEPHRDLEVMRPGQSLNEIVARVMNRVDTLWEELAPDTVVVQGDTTSAFVGALAAFHKGITVAHVEAGLRSGSRLHPFPEEVNRRMVSAATDLHLAPTEQSAQNLLVEGIPREFVSVTGNTAVDALHAVLDHPDLGQDHPVVQELLADPAPAVLITLHRRESWMLPATSQGKETVLEAIFHALAEASRRHPDHRFVYPVHPNPQVRKPAQALLAGLPNFTLTEPLPYFPFVRAMGHAQVIVSDSGGVQEEAPSLGVPVLILRETTERPEGVTSGNNELVGTDPAAIEKALAERLAAPPQRRTPGVHVNPYGDGSAAIRVADALLYAAKRGPKPKDFSTQENRQATHPATEKDPCLTPTP